MDINSLFSSYLRALGVMIINCADAAGRFFAKMFSGFLRGTRYIFKKIGTLSETAWFDSVRAFREEFSYFKKEVKGSHIYIKQAVSENPLSVFSIYGHYIKKALTRHPQMFRKIMNYAMPVFAAVLLIVTVNYWSSKTFALSVTCNGHKLGYVADESVFTDAEEIVRDRLDTGASGNSTEKLLSSTGYSMALVSRNELTDARTISDKIVENADSNVKQACGIYIDGDFLCAVSSETEARQVFNNIKDQYSTSDSNDVIGFVEDIKYVEGLYDSSSIWDAEKLTAKLGTTKTEAVYYTVADGDTSSGIAQKFGVSMSELESLNPGVENVIHTGDKLMISQQVNYVRIKVTKTEVSNEDIAYTTQKVDNANMYKGTTKTSQAGSNGVDKVTRLVTYIDGVQVSSQEVSRETLVEPVNEIIQVGTKSATYSSSGSVGSYTVVAKGSMVWPLTGCYVVSSGYGYRSGGFHGGIDISNGRCYGNIVVAAASGTVTAAGWDSSGYGNKVMINHGNGVVTLYGHMSAVLCSVGQYVNAGDAIGRCGASGNATGPHLHFEVRINGSKVNPAPYIGA